MKQQLQSLASRAYLSIFDRPRLTVLTFHRFGKITGMGLDEVAHHLGFMSRHCEIILPAHMRINGHLDNRQGMITVDDAHGDIYDYLYPVAKRLKVPFVICVPTDYFFREKWLWFDLLYWMLERAESGAKLSIDGRELRLADRKAVAWLKLRLKRCLPPERDALLTDIAGQLRLNCPIKPQDGYEPLSHSQMREMIASGLVEISVHTISHTIATVLPESALSLELQQSKRELEAFSGHELSSFCYPNGDVGDFNETTTACVSNAGFKLALTSVDGINYDGFDPFKILRVHASPKLGSFEKDASGLGQMLAGLRPAR